jgi:hypothetical protein
MAALRQQLRLWAAAWLVFQVATLSAFVPRDCCTAHRPAAITPHTQDHTATDCPMRAVDGAACPMHRGNQTGHHAEHSNHDNHEQPPGSPCSMRGTCDGPMAAMLALLSNHGVLTESIVVSPDDQSTPIPASTRESLVCRLASPDPPPPRS